MEDDQIPLAIKVKKEFGQSILDFLQKNNLLNQKYKIERDPDYLYIPVMDRIDEGEHQLPKFEIIRYPFQSISKKPASLKEALDTLIPDNLQSLIPSAFDQIGDLVVIEIPDELQSYKSEIGSAMLNISNNVKGVFMKTSAVNGLTRTRSLKFLSGSDETFTVHKEYGIRIAVDIEKIYFSPRLSTEHHRITSQISIETVLDMFGACGPFALHIAKNTESTVTSIDINPIAKELIEKSVGMNRLKGQIIPLTGDAMVVGNNLLTNGQSFDRIIMNHPSNALPFLQLAVNLCKPLGKVHFYLFAPIEDHESYCNDLIASQNLNCRIAEIHPVRQYSPQEFHTCITLQKLE